MNSGRQLHGTIPILRLILAFVCVCMSRMDVRVRCQSSSRSPCCPIPPIPSPPSNGSRNHEIYHGRNVWNFPQTAEGSNANKVRSYNFLNNQTTMEAGIFGAASVTSPRIVFPPSRPQFRPQELNTNGNRPRPRPMQLQQQHEPPPLVPGKHKYRPHQQRLVYQTPAELLGVGTHNHNGRPELILTSNTYEYPIPMPPPPAYPNEPPATPAVQNNLYLPPSSPTKLVPSPASTPAPCKDGFDTLVADMTLMSILLSFLSLIFAGLSLFISNFYNVFGSALSVLFAGIPSLILNLFSLADIKLSSHSPFIILITIISVFDSLNNLLSIVPGSLFSDLVGLISILIGKVSFGMGTLSSYPQLLTKVLKFFGVKDLIDTYYGCRTKTLGKFVQDFFSDKVQVFQQDDT